MAMDPPEASGQAAAFDATFSEVYSQLRRLAHRQRRPADDSALDTTALVHELYLQMDRERLLFDSSRQFYTYAARAMRHLLIDRARERARLKRGGAMQRVDLDDSLHGDQVDFTQALELDTALRQLATEDPRAAEIVGLHYFAGLSMDDIAELLQLSARTVARDWRYARAFLYSRLNEGR